MTILGAGDSSRVYVAQLRLLYLSTQCPALSSCQHPMLFCRVVRLSASSLRPGSGAIQPLCQGVDRLAIRQRVSSTCEPKPAFSRIWRSELLEIIQPNCDSPDMPVLLQYDAC